MVLLSFGTHIFTLKWIPKGREKGLAVRLYSLLEIRDSGPHEARGSDLVFWGKGGGGVVKDYNVINKNLAENVSYNYEMRPTLTKLKNFKRS